MIEILESIQEFMKILKSAVHKIKILQLIDNFIKNQYKMMLFNHSDHNKKEIHYKWQDLQHTKCYLL